MAKKKGSQGLDDQIKQLEVAIGEVHACPGCGKAVEPDAATCPHCGVALGEGVELQVQAAESLQDLEKQLEAAAETGPEAPVPASAPAPEPETGGLDSAAEVAAEVAPPPATGNGSGAVEESASAPEAGEPRDLEGFIQEIEAEVGTAAATAPKTARVRAVPRVTARHRSRWLIAVAAGGLLYLVAILTALEILPDPGKLGTASVMILGSVLVAVGLNLRPGGSVPPAPLRAVRADGAPDYVCPLCGTGIPANASECPTCGALFED